jgi:stalled ribosome rescue protein Dom34
MKQKVGVWIDHRMAVIIYFSDNEVTSKILLSNVEKQLGRINGLRSLSPFEDQMVLADDSQENIYKNHMTKYYDNIYSNIKDADSILIFGPGEAKGELKKFLEKNDSGELIAGIETADRMTSRQIIAKVRRYFR